MLCFDGSNTKEFKPLGQLKYVSMFSRFSFLINFTNHIEVCGKLEIKDKTINSATKTFLATPGDKLIDVLVNDIGADILVELNGVRIVYYIGKSFGIAFADYS